MSVPAPPSVAGIENSTEYTSGSGIIDLLFKFYGFITPKYLNRSFPGGNIRYDFEIMNLENRAFNGCRITYSRDVSPHMQLKHTFSLDSAESKAYSYLSEVAFGSGYKQLSQRLWSNVMLRGTVIPSGGVVHGGISAMTTLKQEPNEKPGDNPSHVSVDVDLKSHSDMSKTEKEGLLQTVRLGYTAPGTDIAIVYEDKSVQISYYQQLARRHFGSLTSYFTSLGAGMNLAYRYEDSEPSSYPRNEYAVSANGNNINGFSTGSFDYRRVLSKHLSFVNSISCAPDRTGQLSLRAHSGFNLNYAVGHMKSNFKCILNNAGDVFCSLEDAINGNLSYSLTVHSNIPNNHFGFGFSFNLH